MGTKRVFISYSHDSDAHSSHVLALANQLRRDGIESIIDQYIEAPSEGWTFWMMKEVRDSDFILAVCTPIYYQRFMGDVPKSVGRGARWEGFLTAQYLYDQGTLNDRIIPILLDDATVESIPEPLRASTHYRVLTPSDYEKLYRRITNQPAIVPPTLGEMRTFHRQEYSLLFEEPVEANDSSRAHSHDQILRYIGLSADERASPFAVRFLEARAELSAIAVQQSRQQNDASEILIRAEDLETVMSLLSKLGQMLSQLPEIANGRNMTSQTLNKFLDLEIMPVMAETLKWRRKGTVRPISTQAQELLDTGIPYVILGVAASFSPIIDAIQMALYLDTPPAVHRVKDEILFLTLNDAESAISGLRAFIATLESDEE